MKNKTSVYDKENSSRGWKNCLLYLMIMFFYAVIAFVTICTHWEKLPASGVCVVLLGCVTLCLQTISIWQTKKLSEKQEQENKKERFINLLVYRIDFFEKQRMRLPAPDLFQDFCDAFKKQEICEDVFDYDCENKDELEGYPREYFWLAQDVSDLVLKISETNLLSAPEKDAFKRLVWRMCPQKERGFLLGRTYVNRQKIDRNKAEPLVGLFTDEDIANLLRIGYRSFVLDDDVKQELSNFKKNLQDGYSCQLGGVFSKKRRG